jgi:glycerol-3-phosphate dehydrogenase subunit C
MDACFQCKLCEVQCPYTPRDGHEFQLDFPKLVHRYPRRSVRREGVPFREKVLGDPDSTAASSRGEPRLGQRDEPERGAPVVSGEGARHPPRQAAAGLRRRRPSRSGPTSEGRLDAAPGGEAVLFQTCYVQHNEPQVGRDTLEVLERSKVDVRCVRGLECCGMPAWEHGDLEGLRRQAKANLAPGAVSWTPGRRCWRSTRPAR